MNASATDPRLEGRALRRVAFDEATIAARVKSLGDEITRAYPDGVNHHVLEASDLAPPQCDVR